MAFTFRIEEVSDITEPQLFRIQEVTMRCDDDPECELKIHVHREAWDAAIGRRSGTRMSVSMGPHRGAASVGGDGEDGEEADGRTYACRGKVYYCTPGARGISAGGLLCTLHRQGGGQVMDSLAAGMLGKLVLMRFERGAAQKRRRSSSYIRPYGTASLAS